MYAVIPLHCEESISKLESRRPYHHAGDLTLRQSSTSLFRLPANEKFHDMTLAYVKNTTKRLDKYQAAMRKTIETVDRTVLIDDESRASKILRYPGKLPMTKKEE